MCNEGAFLACTRLGQSYQREYKSEIDTSDKELAIRQIKGRNPDVASLFLYERACENGEQEGCAELGILHRWSIAVPQDFTKAFGLYESTCQQQTATGCYELGEIYELGQSVVPNQVLAVTLYKARVVIWTCPKAVLPMETS